MALTACARCQGLVPSSCDHCPHCDAPVTARRGRAARIAGGLFVGGAFATTLMACYGAPPGQPIRPVTPTAGSASNGATPAGDPPPVSTITPPEAPK